MPKRIQNADLTTALVQEFDLKGRVELELDERVVPVIVTQDLTPNPLTAGNVGMHRQTAVAVVAEFAFTMVVPAQGTRIEVLQIASPSSGFRVITLATAAQLATLEALVTLGAAFESVTRTRPDIPAAAGLPVLQSTLRSGTAVAQVGRELWTWDEGTLKGNVSDWPAPINLYGRPVANPAALVVWHGTVNIALNVQAMVREFQDDG